jgi:superfamily II DNA or RNA helicase
MVTRPAGELTLADRLSHLSFAQACRLLGPRASELLREGGALEIRLEQVRLDPDRLTLELPDARVEIELAPGERVGLGYRCSACHQACLHAGAAFALVLEEKTVLGLAAPPPERIPAPALSEEELVRRAIEERRERAKSERMAVRALDASRPWTDYVVTSAASGRSYRVALRSLERGPSYCSCPDFRKNTLGTCKHILHVQQKARRRFRPEELRRPYRRETLSLFVDYGSERSLRLGLPDRPLAAEAEKVVAGLRGRAIEDLPDLVRRLRELERLGVVVNVHPDAEQLVEERLSRERMRRTVEEIRADPAGHPLRRELLSAELLPYQLDGIAFAAGAGRAILADDMGLGKTIQAIGLAELLHRELGIERVLVVCPASVKSQWRSEIARFCGRGCRLVLGGAKERAAQYRRPCFFTVCNYEQALRDLGAIHEVSWDLVVLDEAQRIKNWEAKTSRALKALRSRFALALSGTPLENRLDELYSVVEFVDERRLGPAFRFFNRHRTLNERGKLLGYARLGELRRELAPILLRRTRESVMRELPPRTTEVLRIEPTPAQAELHWAHMQTVVTIARKRFLTEMDLLRLRKALLMCRMTADATSLVDKREPGHSSKLERLAELLEELLREGDRKILLFSEWTSMLDLVERRLRRLGASWVRLDGSVPQRKRQALVDSFRRDPSLRLFLTTNAGSTGLNLQAANTVVNVDLPWNPAVLEQRIGRVHRMGQRRPVQVFVLVTEGTIEENLLATLSAKHDLALAVLDPDSQVEAVDMLSNMEELRRRLEVLLGARSEAGADLREREAREAELAQRARRERLAAAGGELVRAAAAFLGELLPGGELAGAAAKLGDLVRARLGEGLGRDGSGRTTLTLTLPEPSALEGLAGALGRLFAGAAAPAASPPGDGAARGARGGNGATSRSFPRRSGPGSPRSFAGGEIAS